MNDCTVGIRRNSARGLDLMPRTKNYQTLHERVITRGLGAEERLAQLREQALAEVGLYQLRRTSVVIDEPRRRAFLVLAGRAVPA